MRWRVFFLMIVCLGTGAQARAETALQQEIDCLLDHVRGSDITFLRNGKAHDGDAAARHMERKYDHFRKRVDSAEDFIAYAATKSTVSGRAYQVRLADGQEQPSADYLLDQLAQCREGMAKAPAGESP